jgi:hypothetical protein
MTRVQVASVRRSASDSIRHIKPQYESYPRGQRKPIASSSCARTVVRDSYQGGHCKPQWE